MSLGRPALAIVLTVLVLSAGCAETGAPDPSVESPTTGAAPSQSPPAAPNGTLEVHFINVGQSVSTLVIGPTGETMLIDAGHYRTDGQYVLEYLDRHGIERIDYFVLSHADADHIGGAAAIIKHYETQADGIGAIYAPGIAASTNTYADFLDAVERYNVTLYETHAGDTIPFEGVNVAVLGPPEGYLDDRDRNENSIVLRLSYGRTSFLFTGDAEADAEDWLLTHYDAKLQATVLKAGHHGSNSSTSGALLDAVAPAVVVISSAYDSQYGHPHEGVLERLAARSIPTYWTATHGDVVFVSDGQQITIKTQQPAPTAPLSLREGDPIAPGATNPLEVRASITVSDQVVSPTTVATDGGTTTTAVPGEALVISEIHADAAGNDHENLDDEYIVLTNTGDEPIDLSGWTVEDAAGHTYTFPAGFTLGPGESVTLHTGSGTDTETDLYWGRETAIWNNGGDTIIVSNAAGERILTQEYA